MYFIPSIIFITYFLPYVVSFCAVEKKFTDHIKNLLPTNDLFKIIDTVYEGQYISGKDGVHRFQIIDEWPQVLHRRIENEEMSIPLHHTRHCTMKAMKTQSKSVYIFRYDASAFELAFADMKGEQHAKDFVYTAVIKTNKRQHFVKRYNELVTKRLTACQNSDGYCLNKGKCVRNPITSLEHCECTKDFKGKRCSVRILSITHVVHSDDDSHHIVMIWIAACCALIAAVAVIILVSARKRLLTLEKESQAKISVK